MVVEAVIVNIVVFLVDFVVIILPIRPLPLVFYFILFHLQRAPFSFPFSPYLSRAILLHRGSALPSHKLIAPTWLSGSDGEDNICPFLIKHIVKAKW